MEILSHLYLHIELKIFCHFAGRRMGDSRQPSDEEYDTGDNASVISNASTDVQSLSGVAEGIVKLL